MDTKAFKTKTEFYNRDNGQLSGVWLVALDVGYSAVKLFAPNKVGIFPSYAQPYTNCGTIGQLSNDFITYTDLDTNETWLVGSAAQQEAASDNTSDTDAALFGRQRYFDPMFKVLTRVGLGIALMPNKYGERGTKKICVQTGLPPKYKDDAVYMREVISGHHHFSIKIGNGQPQSFDFDIAPENVYMTLQPLGTLHSISTSNDHKYVANAKDYLGKNIIIFDAGFGTFDLFFVKNHRIVDDGCTFANLGMKRVFMQTADMLRALPENERVNITLTGMQKCLEDGYAKKFDRTTFSTKEIKFDQYLEKAVRNVCEEAIKTMVKVYPIQDANYLVITGGTGAAWSNIIRERLKGMQSLHILDGNQNDVTLPFVFANVRGYYMDRYTRIAHELLSQKE